MEKDKGHLVNIEKVEYNYHNHVDTSEILSLLNILKLQNHKIIMTQQEATQKINALTTQLAKVKTEVEALILAVQNSGNVTPELEAAITSAETALQGVDDLNPDAPPPPQE